MDFSSTEFPEDGILQLVKEVLEFDAERAFALMMPADSVLITIETKAIAVSSSSVESSNSEVVFSSFSVAIPTNDDESVDVEAKSSSSSKKIDSKSSSSSAKNKKEEAKSSNSKGKDAIVSMVQMPMFSVTTVARDVQITGVKVGAPFAIFDMQGHVMTSGRVESENFSLTVPRAGTFVVRIGYETRVVNVK